VDALRGRLGERSGGRPSSPTSAPGSAFNGSPRRPTATRGAEVASSGTNLGHADMHSRTANRSRSAGPRPRPPAPCHSQNYEIAIPAFLTIILMPFTYSITVGIGAGFVSFVLIKRAVGKIREIHPLMSVSGLLFVVYFTLGPIKTLLGV
jgi:hypothetical protein